MAEGWLRALGEGVSSADQRWGMGDRNFPWVSGQKPISVPFSNFQDRTVINNPAVSLHSLASDDDRSVMDISAA